MRSGKTNNDEYPAKGRFKQSLIAGSKPGDINNDRKLGTFKAQKIEFFGVKINQEITSTQTQI